MRVNSAGLQIDSLASLRFLFFLGIFFSHYKWNGEFFFPIGGPMGVSFFFILSGFSLSIGYGSRVNVLDVKIFMKKRIMKIYPMHIITLGYRFITFLLFPLILGEDICKKLIALILNIFLLQAWWPDIDLIFSYNTIAWFLSPIVFFYLLFPYLFSFVDNHRLLFWGPCFIMLYCLGAYIIPRTMLQTILYVSPLFRVFDFVLGIVTYKFLMCVLLKDYSLPIKMRKEPLIPYLIEMGIGIIILMIILISPYVDLRWRIASFFWLPLVVTILSLSLSELYTGGGWLSKALFKRLGSASYEMYMIHAIIISLFQHGFDKYTQGRNNSQLMVMAICFICVVVIGLALHIINNKLVKWISR